MLSQGADQQIQFVLPQGQVLMYVKGKKGLPKSSGRIAGLTALLFFCFGITVWACDPLAPIHIAYFGNDNETHSLLRSSDKAGDDLNWQKDLHKWSRFLSSLPPDRNSAEKELHKQSQCYKQDNFSPISLRSPPLLFCY